MNASQLMTKAVRSCSPDDTLQRAAQLMWEGDCGAVPVVDAEDRVVGMITDRDVTMAAYTQGRALCEIPVASAMANQVHGVRENDSIDLVETLMRRARVRRVPVLDGGGRLQGIISMNDLARHAMRSGRKADGLRPESIVQTLAAISEPRQAQDRREQKPTAAPAQLPS